MPRDTCDNCPANEPVDGRPWCLWYEGWTNNIGCGNDFKCRPAESQRQAEEALAAMSDEELMQLATLSDEELIQLGLLKQDSLKEET